MARASGKPLTFDAICRRAGGRRHYNKQRQVMAWWRRLQLWAALIRSDYGIPPGQIAAWAAEHKVSTKTIYLDLRQQRIREAQQLRQAIFERVVTRRGGFPFSK